MIHITTDTLKKFNLAMNIIALVYFMIYAVWLITKLGNPAYSTDYVIIYLAICLVSLVFTFISLGLSLIKFVNEEIGDLIFISTSSEFRPLSNSIYWKVGAMVFLTLVIIAPLSLGFQVYPITEPFAQDASYTQTERITAIATVGTGEDCIFSLMLTNIFIVIFWLISYFGLKYDFKENMAVFIVIILVASLMSSFSLGILPSFSEAHKKAYELNQQAYLSAGAFNFVVAVLQQLTGMFFFGLPHDIHNLLVGLNYMIVFSVGLFAFMAIPTKQFKRCSRWMLKMAE